MSLAEIAPSGILQAQVGKAQRDRRLDDVQQDLFIFFGLLCRGALRSNVTAVVPFCQVEAQEAEGIRGPLQQFPIFIGVLPGALPHER